MHLGHMARNRKGPNQAAVTARKDGTPTTAFLRYV